MPSFDIVSDLNMQEVDNAVNQVAREISQRFDFRGSSSSIELDKIKKQIKIMADDDMRLRSIHQLLELKIIKREVDMRCLKYGDEEPAGGNMIRQVVDLKSGLDREEAKEVTKLIKDSKLKVQAEIQDEQIRISGKKIDDLQSAMATIRGAQLKFPVQFVNMRS